MLTWICRLKAFKSERLSGTHRQPILMNISLFAAALTIVLSSVATLAPAQGSWTDPKYGYSIGTLKGWESVPVQPTERYLIAKWVSPRRERGLPAEMEIYRYDKKAKAPEIDPEVYGGEIPAGVREAIMGRAPKSSYADWVKADRIRKDMKLGKKRKLKIKSPKERPAKGWYYVTQRPSGYSRGAEKSADFLMVIGVFETENYQFAVECYCSTDAARKFKGKFQSLVKSIKVLEVPEELKAERADAANAAEEDAADDGYARAKETPMERATERAKETAKRNPGWWYIPTQRYLILTNVDKRRKPFIKELGKRLEAMRDLYEKDFPPAKPIDAVSIVRVCKDQKTYSDYGGPGGSAGYWYSAAEELVFYRDSGNKKTPFAVLNHEAFHQYIFYCSGNISPHSWYNEGYGDYYAGAKIQGSRVLGVNPFLWRRDIIKSAARAGTHVPIKKIIRYTQGDYYSNSSLCYAEGWSIIYFLNKALPKNHAWRKILPTYLQVIQETRDREKAVDAAFEGVDLDKFEAAWLAFTIRGTKVK